MSRLERLALLGFFTGVVALLARVAPLTTGLGAVAGVAAGLVVAPRMGRLRSRIDATLGADDTRRGFRANRVVVRAVLQLGVLGAILLSTVLIQFIGDELFAGLAAAATGLPFVVTAARLR